MLRPFFVVGIGGSGGNTVRAARQALKFKLDQQGWDGGWPEAWQFLQIDSPTSPDGLSFPAPLLPQEDYLSLVPNNVGYRVLHDKVLQGLGSKHTLDVQRSLPSPSEVKVPVDLGAG
ncbi:MAG: tubulin-like doman-containing protein, partial [Pontimonas sp.]|nr:tubulin-like doman-containing protein [Pontimonas sp.]